MAAASYLNAIRTAAPPHDVHAAFIDWATSQLRTDRERALFARMADRAGIDHRMSVLAPPGHGGTQTDSGGFYGDAWPGTADRMRLYANTRLRSPLMRRASWGRWIASPIWCSPVAPASSRRASTRCSPANSA
ncbi:hypothetical protein, partial [Escherichia coli]|uniref:hypothetical protein n=1 Tax=Escherichia coli TaxID=562 RepID=UPI001909DCEA